MLKRPATAVVVTIMIAALVLTATVVATASPAKRSTHAATLVVGGIHLGSVKDAGYNQAQHDGLVYMQKHVAGVKLIEASNIPEAPQVETVIQNMINQGAKLIFPQSFGYQDFTLNVAAKERSVDFEHPAGFKSAPNFGTYWAASSPINYALGAAAAMVSKHGKLGFVGSIPIPTIIASADAFQLGARSVKPNIKTYVIFNGSFSDPGKEAADVNTFANRGVDVVAGLVDSPITYVKTAESRHIFAVGYHSKAAQKYAPKYWLSGVDFNWGTMFVQMAKQVKAGTWKARNWIAPVGAGVAKLAPFGPRVPAKARAKALRIVRQFATGMLPQHVTPSDQKGTLRVKKGVQPPQSFEQSVTWLAKGMIGNTK